MKALEQTNQYRSMNRLVGLEFPSFPRQQAVLVHSVCKDRLNGELISSGCPCTGVVEVAWYGVDWRYGAPLGRVCLGKCVYCERDRLFYQVALFYSPTRMSHHISPSKSTALLHWTCTQERATNWGHCLPSCRETAIFMKQAKPCWCILVPSGNY